MSDDSKNQYTPVGDDLTHDQASDYIRWVEQSEIYQLIEKYIEKYGCGDSSCDSCKLGVSIGLTHLDDSFNQGAKMIAEVHNTIQTIPE